MFPASAASGVLPTSTSSDFVRVALGAGTIAGLDNHAAKAPWSRPASGWACVTSASGTVSTTRLTLSVRSVEARVARTIPSAVSVACRSKAEEVAPPDCLANADSRCGLGVAPVMGAADAARTADVADNPAAMSDKDKSGSSAIATGTADPCCLAGINSIFSSKPADPVSRPNAAAKLKDAATGSPSAAATAALPVGAVTPGVFTTIMFSDFCRDNPILS